MKKRQLMAVLLSLTLMGSTVVSPLTALATTEELDTFQTQTAGDTDFVQQEGAEDSFETGEIAEEENSTFQNGGQDALSLTEVDGVYQIGTASQLQEFALLVNGDNSTAAQPAAKATLTQNIDLSGTTWIPIGTGEDGFTGSFDGNGFTVEGMNIPADNTSYAGLFATNYGEIKNLTVGGSIASTVSRTGGIVGDNRGTIVNCHSQVAITSSAASGRPYIGGIAGQNTGDGNIQQCSFGGSIDATAVSLQARIGGIVGENAAPIEGCVNLGTLSGPSGDAVMALYMVGGIAGNNTDLIHACYNNGNITGSGTNGRLGGIAGYARNGSSVLNCYSSVSVSGTNYSSNGIGSVVNGANLFHVFYLDDGVAHTDGTTPKTEDELRSGKIIEELNTKNDLEIAVSDGYSFVKTDAYPALNWENKEAAPMPVAAVAISGEAVTGATLTALATGSDGQESSDTTYQWMVSEDKTSFTEIADAVDATFVIPEDYTGKYLQVAAYGVDQSSAVSEPTAQIEKSDGTKLSEDQASLAISNGPSNGKIEKAMQLVLPTAGENKSSISWKSSAPAVIATDGTVTLPETGIADVTLTATLTLGAAEPLTKEFVFHVYSAQATTDQGLLETIVNTYQSQVSVIAPVSGSDTNINEFLKKDIKNRGLGEDIQVTVVKAEARNSNLASYGGVDVPTGDIQYFYYDPNKLGDIWYNKMVQYDVTFQLSKGDAKTQLTQCVNLNWDVQKVKDTMTADVADQLTEEVLKGTNESLDKVTSDLTLPQYLGGKDGGKLWCRIGWSSSDPEALEIKAPSGDSDQVVYGDYTGKVSQGSEEKTVTLTATLSFEQSGGDSSAFLVKKDYTVTILPADITSLEAQMQQALDQNYTVDKLKYFGTSQPIDQDKIHDDIQLLRPAATGIADYGKYKFTASGSDEDLMTVNGYRAVVYRPLPGEKSATVTLTVTMASREFPDAKVSKDFTLTVEPLTQKEIDAEVNLMEIAKANFLQGILGEGNTQEAVVGNMHAFQEMTLDADGKTPKFVYNIQDTTDKGIHPVTLVKDPVNDEDYMKFKSSRPDIIQNSNLLLKKPQYNTQVTISACLSSQTFEKYAEKYPDNEQLQTLYRQAVSATVNVLGADGESPNPDQKYQVSFAMNGDTDHGKEGHSQYEPWILPVTTEVAQGATAADVVLDALNANHYTYEGSGAYLSSITSPFGVTLKGGETNGSRSGWMYMVNGEIPQVTLDQYYLKSGDQILLYFTDDYTKDYQTPYTQEDLEKASQVSALIQAIGDVTYESEGAIQKARDAYEELTDIQKKLVTSKENLEAAEKQYLQIQKARDAFLSGKPVVKAKSASYTSVTVTWEPYENADTYYIYRKTAGGKFTRIGQSQEKLSYTDKTAVTGTTYYYTVKAASKNWGATVYSKYVTDVIGKATLAKGAITKAQSWGYNGVKLSWQQIAGADGYRLYVKSSPNGTYSYVTQIRKGETTSYVHTGRTTGKTYYYILRAYRMVDKEYVFGAYSKSVSGKALPRTVTITKATAGDRQVSLTWDKANGASGYRIYYRTSPDGSWKYVTQIGKGSTTSYRHTGLKKGQTCYYKIRAYRTVSGEKIFGNYSAQKAVKVK